MAKPEKNCGGEGAEGEALSVAERADAHGAGASGLRDRSEHRQFLPQLHDRPCALGEARAGPDRAQDRRRRLRPRQQVLLPAARSRRSSACWRMTASIRPNPTPGSTSRWSMPSPRAPSRCSRPRWDARSTGAAPTASAARARTTMRCARRTTSASSSSIRTPCSRPTPTTARRRMGSCSATSRPTRPARAAISPASASSPACRRTSSRTR